MKMDPKRATAPGFWRYSSKYFHAAEILRKAQEQELLMPTLQLYGQSIELTLKAFLLKRGMPLDEVKSLSHKLFKIIALARKRKLGTEVKLSKRDVELIKLLSDNYSIHRFRYIESGFIRTPPLADIASVCQRLVSGLKRYCMVTCS